MLIDDIFEQLLNFIVFPFLELYIEIYFLGMEIH